MMVFVARGDAVGRGTALQAGKSQAQLPIVSLQFLIDMVLPENTPAFKHNIYWGVKAAGA